MSKELSPQQLEQIVNLHVAEMKRQLPQTQLIQESDIGVGVSDPVYTDSQMSGFIPVDSAPYLADVVGEQYPIPGYVEALPMTDLLAEIERQGANVTVVVPTFNELSNIERTLNDLLRLPIQFKILVLDSGSSDGTRDRILELFPDIAVQESLDGPIKSQDQENLDITGNPDSKPRITVINVVEEAEKLGFDYKGKGGNIDWASKMLPNSNNWIVCMDADHEGNKAGQVQALTTGLAKGYDFSRSILRRWTQAGVDIHLDDLEKIIQKIKSEMPETDINVIRELEKLLHKPGERVTRLTAVPLLVALGFNPDALSALTGEFAVKGNALNEAIECYENEISKDSTGMPKRYGIETMLLFRISEERTAQVYCGPFLQVGQTQTGLEPMAHQVTQTALYEGLKKGINEQTYNPRPVFYSNRWHDHGPWTVLQRQEVHIDNARTPTSTIFFADESVRSRFDALRARFLGN